MTIIVTHLNIIYFPFIRFTELQFNILLNNINSFDTEALYTQTIIFVAHAKTKKR